MSGGLEDSPCVVWYECDLGCYPMLDDTPGGGATFAIDLPTK
jgi:hypothetical protein